MSGLSKKIRDKKRPFCSCVVVAAGFSERMGEDKTELCICGEKTIYRTLRALNSAEAINEIIVVTRAEKIAETAGL